MFISCPWAVRGLFGACPRAVRELLWAVRFCSWLFMNGSQVIRGLFVDCSWVLRGLVVGCSRALQRLVLENCQKLCVKYSVCLLGVRQLFTSSSWFFRGCSGTVRRTAWALPTRCDQLRQSRWDKIAKAKLLGHNIRQKLWDKTFTSKTIGILKRSLSSAMLRQCRPAFSSQKPK